jgi:hypothetical protein
MALYTMRCRSTALLPSNAAATTSMLRTQSKRSRRQRRAKARRMQNDPACVLAWHQNEECATGQRDRERRVTRAQLTPGGCAGWGKGGARLTWRPSPCMSVTFTSSVASAAAICAPGA